MIDTKLKTLLAIMETGSFTRAAEKLSLSQPAVSYHIRQLEDEHSIKVFYANSRTLTLTPEGEILHKFAKRLYNISENARQELLDCKQTLRHFTVGITPTVGEALMSGVLAAYCDEHRSVCIKIVIDSIENLYNMLTTYELDFAIAEGAMPMKHCRTSLMDMDYLCVAVSPLHSFAARQSITLDELKKERIILRTHEAGTRQLFESALARHSENIADYKVFLEMDDLNAIKALVASNLGVTVMAHSACRQDESAGRLKSLTVDGLKMVREINLVCRNDFGHDEVIESIRQIYNGFR